MFFRHGIILTREGWYFIFVALFILGGAVLRDVNLLVILGGMMVGPLLFSWRLAKFRFQGVSVERRLPVRMVAGEFLSVEIILRSDRRRFGSWGMLAIDRVSRDGEARPSPIRAEVLIPHLPAGGQRRGTYRIRLPRRGRYNWGPISVSTRLPLGLMRVWERFPVTSSTVVLPRQGRLTREWALRVLGEGAVGRLSQRHSVLGGDYFGLREWRTGDSRRWIHWRTSAKLGTPAVLQFEQPHRHQIALVVDLWAPPQPDEKQAGLVELAVTFVATAIADLGRRGGSQLKYYLHGQTAHAWTGPASLRSCETLLEQLALVAPTDSPLGGAGLPEVCRGLSPQETVVFVSTRAAPVEPARLLAQLGISAQMLWIHVGEPQLEQYFELPVPGERDAS